MKVMILKIKSLLNNTKRGDLLGHPFLFLCTCSGGYDNIIQSSNEIIEETNYYPFGLAHKGYNQKNDALMKDYKYQYNGKEKQEELGLNFYDYGARNYDAAIGRWMNVDPLAEKFVDWTPYHYVHNNPINAIDPDGRDIIYLNSKGSITKVVNEGNSHITINDKGITKSLSNYDIRYPPEQVHLVRYNYSSTLSTISFL